VKRLAAFLIVALSAAAPAAAAADAAKFDFVGFFLGRTHAESEIKVGFRKPVRHITDSVGRRAANGDMILFDSIKEDGKPKKERRWVVRRSGPNSFTAVMTEAVGPVQITIDGVEATIRYRMKGGVRVDQTLKMRDRKTLTNHVAAKKLGVRLGRLDGTIRKLD
jgi:hypothetical protein